MEPRNGITGDLLRRWHAGDARALDELLALHLPWIRDRVHKRLGAALREKAETGDIVQDSLLQFLRYGPRFVIGTDEQFRKLLARIVENVLRDKLDFFSARRRQMAREQPLGSDTVLSLDPPRAEVIDTPSQAAAREEDEAWMRLALELLDPDERRLLVLREWDDLSFREIGERLGISDSAAKMRHHRAIASLAHLMSSLRKGQLPDLPDL